MHEFYYALTQAIPVEVVAGAEAEAVDGAAAAVVQGAGVGGDVVLAAQPVVRVAYETVEAVATKPAELNNAQTDWRNEASNKGIAIHLMGVVPDAVIANTETRTFDQAQIFLRKHSALFTAENGFNDQTKAELFSLPASVPGTYKVVGKTIDDLVREITEINRYWYFIELEKRRTQNPRFYEERNCADILVNLGNRDKAVSNAAKIHARAIINDARFLPADIVFGRAVDEYPANTTSPDFLLVGTLVDSLFTETEKAQQDAVKVIELLARTSAVDSVKLTGNVFNPRDDSTAERRQWIRQCIQALIDKLPAFA